MARKPVQHTAMPELVFPVPSVDLRFVKRRYARILQQRFTREDGSSVWLDVPEVHDDEVPSPDS